MRPDKKTWAKIWTKQKKARLRKNRAKEKSRPPKEAALQLW
jgi:hypothetical protein